MSIHITAHGGPLPESCTFRGHNARDPRQIDAAVADGWCGRAEAEGEANAGDGHSATLYRRGARQSREYELICGCCSSACVQCLGLTGACTACSHCTPTAWDLQTLITLTRRPLSVSRALHVLSSCVLCLAPPAVDLLEALDRCVCTRRACCFCMMRISHFCCFR